MRRQLEHVHERGEPLAALWASESQIYGRFGYGLAAEGVDLCIERVRAGFASPTEPRGRTRQVDADEARESWPSLWEAVRRGQPGMMPRSDTWWSGRVFRDPESRRSGFTANVYVSYEVDGELHGYVIYRTKPGDEHGWPAGTLRVEELMATTDDAYAALWQYVFGVDLVATIEAPWRKVDEPLYWMLSDPRRLVRHPHDSLWVRVVDVPAALAGRSYRAEGAVTFRVRDPFCAWVAGVYRLESGPAGASCRRVETTPEFEVSAADLGACYLGGTRFAALARAGRVNGEASAIARADAMLAWDPLPWCPEIF
jgi:predicted acetyltransferase